MVRYDGTTNPINLPSDTTPAQLEAAIDAYGRSLAPEYAPDGTFQAVAGAGQMIWDAAHFWQAHGYIVNQDVLCGDVIKEAAALQSLISRKKNNPSGLGATNDAPYRNADVFHHLFYGLLATAAHMLNYLVGYGPWSGVDPRTDVLRGLGYLGIADELRDLNGKWAVPGTNYGEGVGGIATRVAGYGPKETIMPNPIIQRSEIYGVPFRVSIIPVDNPNRVNGPWESVASPIVHETGNRNAGTNAEMHRRFVHNGGGREHVSFQFVVDDHEIIQLLPLYEAGRHAGEHDCNYSRPGIEHCVNSDGDFNQTMANGAKLVRFLGEYDSQMAGDPVQHWNCSGKDCPMMLRDGRWEEYLQLVGSTNVPLPADPNAQKWTYPGDGNEYWIVNTTTEDGHEVRMLDFYRQMGGTPRLGYPKEGMHRLDAEEPVIYTQRTENVLMECWPDGFGSMPGPYYRFGLIP